jgi:hypothetical protein
MREGGGDLRESIIILFEFQWKNRFWILYVLCVFHHFILVPSDLSTSLFFYFSLPSRSLVFILPSEDLSLDFPFS